MILYAFFAVLSIISLTAAIRYSPPEAMRPLAVYCFSYLLTTAIGATIIAILPEGIELLDLYGGGVDIKSIDVTQNLKFWFILYTPFVIPVLTCTFLIKLNYLGTIGKRLDELTLNTMSLPSFLIVYACIAGYCTWQLSRNGYLANLSQFVELQGNYVAMIQLRDSIFNQMGRAFFGLLYTSLPTLSHIALYQSIVTKRRVWWITFFVSSVVFCVLLLLTMQKAPLILYFIFLIVGYTLLNNHRIWTLGIGFLAGVLLLNIFQLFILGDWTIVQSIFHLLFRMGSAFPFYTSLFPDTFSFTGVDFGMDIFGLAEKPSVNEVVHDYMYPLAFVTGSAPAPAHLNAYAQAGIIYSVITLFLIGLVISVVAKLGKNISCMTSYILYMQGLITLYYLTQLSIREALITSYGFVWTILTLGLLWLITDIVRAAGAKKPLE